MGTIIDQNSDASANDTWALVTNGVVVNTIISNFAGIQNIQSQYDYLVDLTIQGQTAGIGWTYTQATDTFAAPASPPNNYIQIVQDDFDQIVNDLLQVLSDVYVAGNLSPDQVASAFAAAAIDSSASYTTNMSTIMTAIYNFVQNGG
jgi:hypothetical protein